MRCERFVGDGTRIRQRRDQDRTTKVYVRGDRPSGDATPTAVWLPCAHHAVFAGLERRRPITGRRPWALLVQGVLPALLESNSLCCVPGLSFLLDFIDVCLPVAHKYTSFVEQRTALIRRFTVVSQLMCQCVLDGFLLVM